MIEEGIVCPPGRHVPLISADGTDVIGSLVMTTARLTPPDGKVESTGGSESILYGSVFLVVT